MKALFAALFFLFLTAAAIAAFFQKGVDDEARDKAIRKFLAEQQAEAKEIHAKTRFDDESDEKKVPEKGLSPNILTSKQIADGALLLFDGETTFGWRIDGERTLGWRIEGEAAVKDGWLILGGTKATKAYLPTHFPDNYKLTYEAFGKGGSDKSFIVQTERVSKDDGFQKGGSGMHDDLRRHYVASSRVDGILTLIDDSGPTSTWSSRNTTPATQEMHFEVPANCTLHLRDVKLKMTQATSLLNGKDLAGWKKYQGDAARAKSEFSVNKSGELTIKNGPGDLQTEKSFDDFILQLDCKTNGKNLNGGVRFRCLPGEFQSGYEAKIHNGWTEEPEKEYTIDISDPRTPGLQPKIKSAAINWGTGALQGHLPARKAVARDNEWFTMTVMAQGRHIATWVNGIQVVDWTDNRPVNDDARKGCCLESGPISLQGDDPTTDLCFRNIRITELPRVKK